MPDTYILTNPVEAVMVTGQNRNADDDDGSGDLPGNMRETAEWLDSAVTVGHDRRYEVEVPGARYARPGDWIVKLGDGVFEVLTAAQFDTLYRKHGGASG